MKKLVLIACLALPVSLPALAGDPAAGQTKSKPCAVCHGADGNSASAEFPKLAGQHYDYLVRAIKDYKAGSRKSPIMAPMVEKLTVRDIEDLAAYYSSRKGLVVKY